jgi:hypothetical protein
MDRAVGEKERMGHVVGGAVAPQIAQDFEVVGRVRIGEAAP